MEDDVESDVTAIPTALQTAMQPAVGGPGEPCAAIGIGFNIGDVVEAPWLDGKLYVGVVWYTWKKDGVQEKLFVHFDDCDSSNPLSPSQVKLVSPGHTRELRRVQYCFACAFKW